MGESKWTSRKLCIALLALLLASFLVWFDKIDATSWSMVFGVTVGAYLAGQAWVDRNK